MKSLFRQMLDKVSPEIKKCVEKQMDIAVQIAEVLKRKNIKQKELAKMLGMKESQISKIMSGNANLTIKTIAKIESVLGEDIIQVPFYAKKTADTPCIVSEYLYLKNNEETITIPDNSKYITIKDEKKSFLEFLKISNDVFIHTGNA